MSLSPGTSLGHYDVTSLLGEGGMGQVWQATDTQLNRQVALKILPDAFADDPDRLARFTREAQILASLNHPNIAAIYGIEEAEGTRALVLELVEGPTLGDRIAQGPIPLDEALPIAKQIAEALEAAHEAGVIHRDLKPANIKVKADGTVKVLDFGLAKALAGDAQGPDLSQSPTMTASMSGTREGVILGTAAYMSPEQARGQTLDKRTDIWSFGCVLYEMLTGRTAFGGDTLSDTIANVIEREPDWKRLPASLPPLVRRLIRRCLVKDRRDRLHDVADARLEIAEATRAPGTMTSEAEAVPGLKVWQRPLPAAIVASVLAAVIGLGGWVLTRPDPGSVMRFTIAPPASAPLVLSGLRHDLAISPDGTQIVYGGAPAGLVNQLNLRSIDELEGEPLRGTAGGVGPFVSRDGQWVGFATGSRMLLKVPMNGGPTVPICQSSEQILGASWGGDNKIVFGTSGSLFSVPAGGGEPEALTRPGVGERHTWPFIIPGANAVLFVTATSAAVLTTGQLAVLDLDNMEVTPLGLVGTSPQYVSTGHLLYATQDGTVQAVGFDVTRLELTSDPVPVVEGVAVTDVGGANFSVSDQGRLFYVRSDVLSRADSRTLVWVNRDGDETRLGLGPGRYSSPRLSPDGTRVAFALQKAGNQDIVIYDLTLQRQTLLTFDSAQDDFPLWTPDGQRVVFRSDRDGERNLYWKPADGTGDVTRLTTSQRGHSPMAWSSDGTQLVINDGGAISVLSMEGGSQVEPLLAPAHRVAYPAISPDGRWMAYKSTESGHDEIYMKPFPAVDDGKWLVAPDGDDPVWARNGRELFYRGSGGRMMAMPIEFEPTPSFGSHEVLFAGRYMESGVQYDVAQDGRFLIVKESESTDGSSALITVALNWFEELKRLVPIAQ